MLLRNDSRVIHSIAIKLVFDDSLVRELTIQEGDYVNVSYRKNGCVKCGVGMVKSIRPYAFTKTWTCAKESATIIVDMSTDLQSNIDSFDMFDIVDIRKILPVDCKCCCCNVGNDVQDPTTETPTTPDISGEELEGSGIGE